jgi:small subunit ribosomal protein S7
MRRAKPERREILPDIRFNSVNVQTMVQHVLKRGKKSTATRLIYDAMEMIQERTQKNRWMPRWLGTSV